MPTFNTSSKRTSVRSAIGTEDRAIKSIRKKSPGTSSGEARRVHRRRNQRVVETLKAGIASRRKKVY